jgi:hypothetical protein
MKTKIVLRFIKFSFLILVIPLLLIRCSSSHKAAKLSSDEIKNVIDSSQFTFVAERVNPLRGSTRYLTSRYNVVIKKDTIDCDLPYFGRAFQAPVDPSKGGIRFVSSDFSRSMNSKKENEWEVLIKPNDNADVQQLSLDIFNNGTATLNVTNTHRDPISFYGHIERIKEQ